MCRSVGCVVVNASYRLAPEHPFPVSLDDGCTVIRWVLDHKTVLGKAQSPLVRFAVDFLHDLSYENPQQIVQQMHNKSDLWSLRHTEYYRVRLPFSELLFLCFYFFPLVLKCQTICSITVLVCLFKFKFKNSNLLKAKGPEGH